MAKSCKKVRAGKSLKPKRWKNNARVAVALSFDSDHETTTLRWGMVLQVSYHRANMVRVLQCRG